MDKEGGKILSMLDMFITMFESRFTKLATREGQCKVTSRANVHAARIPVYLFTP